MCGRTTLTITPDDLERAFGYTVPAGYRPRYNIAPTQPLLAIADGEGGARFRSFRWGLVPFWAQDLAIGNRMINARAETVPEKPAFRTCFENRRCLIVIDGFYEWRAGPEGRRPYRIRLSSGVAFTLAGLWDRWTRGAEPVESCTILTTTANPMMGAIHDRMPVIVPPEDRERWLSRESDSADLLDLLQPYRGADLEAYEVSTLVNSPANDRPECLDPV